MNKKHMHLQFSFNQDWVFNEKEKTISGTFATYGEVAKDRNILIQAGALIYNSEIPVFIGHWTDPTTMVGIATVSDDNNKALKGEVTFVNSYKYTDNVLLMIKSQMLAGFSVGLRDVDKKIEKGKPTVILSAIVQELSIVEHPALEGAKIQASRKEVEIMEKLSCADWEDMPEEQKLEALENIFSKKLSVEFLSLIKEVQNLYKVLEVYKKLENYKGVK